MKKIIYLLLTMLLFFISAYSFKAAAQISADVPFRIMKLDDALETAKNENIKVVINVYADWCPYCKQMHDHVYPSTEVADVMKDHFIMVYINIDSEEKVTYLDKTVTHAQFARALNSRSTPTTYFMKSDGEIIGHQPGLLSPEIFSGLLRYIASDAYLNQTFEEFSDS